MANNIGRPIRVSPDGGKTISASAVQIALDDIYTKMAQLGNSSSTTSTSNAGLIRTLFIKSSGQYTPSNGTTLIRVRMCGGGGGGGSATAGSTPGTYAGAPGGGSGAYLEFTVSDPTAGSVVVGAAGAAGTVGVDGGTGGDTILNINGRSYTAKGGAGGPSYNAGASTSFALTGGAPGGISVPTGTDRVHSGCPGRIAFLVSGLAAAVSGDGGDSVLGVAGQAAQDSQGIGGSASGYGAGGGGGNCDPGYGTANGGAGSPGIVIIDEY